MSLGVPELLVIGVLVVLLFGASRVKALGTGLGEAFREFRKTERDVKDVAKELKK